MNKKEWFYDWFNSKDYLEVYNHRDDLDALSLVNLICSRIKLENGKKVLDLACGTGRHSILFAKRGYLVTGVDLSELLLDQAKKRAMKENLDIVFIKSDLRKFDTDEKFDLIINVFTSFGYFKSDEENFSLFKNVYKFLNDDGYFVFDFFNKFHLLSNLIPITEEKVLDKLIIQKRFVRKGRVEKIIEITSDGNKRIFRESVKLYSKDEIIKKLQDLGFEIQNTFGDFEGNDFDIENSPRFIVFCKK